MSNKAKHMAGVVPALLIIVLLWASTCLASPEIKPKRVVLKNGITLLFVETHALPIVNISVAIKAGAIYDPSEKGGVASLTAALLDEGTKNRSSIQIAEEIDFIGGRLSASGGEDFSSASLVVLKRIWQQVWIWCLRCACTRNCRKRSFRGRKRRR